MSMPLHRFAAATVLAQRIGDTSPSPNPMQAYRAYLGAIARREFATVVASMTKACARQLHGLRNTPDFHAMFELWCESQRDPIIVTHCIVEDDLATIDVRGRHTSGQVTMRLVDGAWLIDSELHEPRRVPVVL